MKKISWIHSISGQTQKGKGTHAKWSRLPVSVAEETRRILLLPLNGTIPVVHNRFAPSPSASLLSGFLGGRQPENKTYERRAELELSGTLMLSPRVPLIYVKALGTINTH